MSMRRSARIATALLCGLAVALVSDAVLNATTSEEIALGGTLLLVTVTMLTITWTLR